MYVCMSHVVCLWRPKDGAETPGTRVKDSCELQCGYCDSNLGHLKDQTGLSIVSLLSSPLVLLLLNTT